MFQEVMHLLTKEYSIVLASGEEDIAEVKKIRKEILLPKYQNFASIEDEDLFLFNKDDEQSFIYLLRHNPTQTFVGTIRVFFINDTTPIQTLPMQKDGNVKGIEDLTKDLPICEVSRLALSGTLPKYKDLSALRLRTYLTMGLMSTIGINIFLYKYTKVFSIMEPSLHRILTRQGVNFISIGEVVDYYGMRMPYAIEREKLIDESKNILGQLTLFYLKELCQNSEKFWQFIDNNPYLQHSDIQLDMICRLFQKHGENLDIPLLLQDQNVD
jgi:N-acyl-L-homoserine lactone synthetase